MEQEQKKIAKAGKYIAFSGILTALAVVVMLLGSYFTVAAYALTGVASFLVYVIRTECDLRHGIAAYVCICLLGLLFVPYKEIVWLFLLLAGYYPLLKNRLDTLRFPLLRVAVKLLICNSTMVFFFYSTVNLIYTGQMLPEYAQYAKLLAIGFVILGNAAFLCFDLALGRVLRFYRQHLSPRLRKSLGFPQREEP